MDLLLQALQQLPEFRQLLDTVQSGGAAAATGLAQINRDMSLPDCMTWETGRWQ